MNYIHTINFIVHEFIKKYPDKKLQMEENKHYFNKNNIVSPNPHHLEDSTWAHTMMTLTAFKSIANETDFSYEELLILSIVLMTHDYGKVLTRSDDPLTQKVSFKGHGEYSTTLTVDFAKHIFQLPEFSDKNIDVAFAITTSAWLSSRHMFMYDIKTIPKLNSFVNYNATWYKLLVAFSKCDELGRMKISDDRSSFDAICKSYNSLGIDSIEKTEELVEDNLVDFYIYVGLPGSGKDYHANADFLNIISFDQLRLEYYKINTKDDLSTLSSSEIYKNAFSYCNSSNVDLNKLLTTKIKAYRDLKDITSRIAICNTNLHIKSRRSLINIIRSIYPDATIGCRVLLTNVDDCISRDLQRESHDKSVGSHIVQKLSNITIPTYNESFNSIRYIIN